MIGVWISSEPGDVFPALNRDSCISCSVSGGNSSERTGTAGLSIGISPVSAVLTRRLFRRMFRFSDKVVTGGSSGYLGSSKGDERECNP